MRSGVLTSVHAFAQDPARGMFILAFLLTVTGGGLALYAWRAPQLQGGGLFQPVSREGALILNNLLLCTLAATVLLGTLYPLFLDLLTGNKVSVGPPFFNATFVPICAPLFAALCVGPFLGWKRAELWPALMQLRVAFIVCGDRRHRRVLRHRRPRHPGRRRLRLRRLADRGQPGRVRQPPAAGPRAAGGVAAPPARDAARRLGMTIAHTALGFVVLGAVATGAWHLELMHTMKPGETVHFAGYEVTLQQVDEVKGPNYIAERATLAVTYDGKPYTTLQPERRLFPVQRRQVAETAIHTNLLRDFYVTLGEGDAKTGWVIRLYLNPLAPWIWLGAALLRAGRLRVPHRPPPQDRRALAPAGGAGGGVSAS